MNTRFLHVLFPVLLAVTLAACDDPAKKSHSVPLTDPIATSAIDFNGTGRLNYKITGPTWETPNVEVTDRLFELVEGQLNARGELVPEILHMAAYASGGQAQLTVFPAWRGEGEPPAGTYHFMGVLMASDGTELPWFDQAGELTPAEGGGYAPVVIDAASLPASTARVWELAMTHVYTVAAETYTHTHYQEVAQTWRAPLPVAPLYQQILRWGGEWIDGFVEDLGEPTENQLAETLLFGMNHLADLGYRYGPFPRPSDIVDRAEVFLDFKQSACGEFRGFYMALVESQGIDANWLWFWFNKPSSTWYSMYETIVIAALGRTPQVWRYQDHIVVEVNGVVYDPTYVVTKPDATAYEDFMFARFCFGEDESCKNSGDWCTLPGGPQGVCIDNPPGHDLEIGPGRFRGEDYR
ncbi:MAG: hypothetical protein CVU65_02975 [Deltaproteobacteria bacterium HGW-Deltaproteobacteria-22]|nr:MAG: hypothetical protein CVU65_02975 [Deltaproteobacteria bacterium HGW-Deltaproteobacteria-22]